MHSEFLLIKRLQKIFSNADSSILCGIGDDCAVYKPHPDKQELLTVDSFVEDVHFKRKWTHARQAGVKALAVNLSDIAAMGGKPRVALVSLTIPQDTDENWVCQFCRGVQSLGKKWGMSIVGGNISRAAQFSSHITVLGEALKNKIKYRKGARVGDVIYVSGPLGLPHLALYCLENNLRVPPHALLAFNSPAPCVKEGLFLGALPQVTSMIDLSDGLLGDLSHVLKASKVGAQIELSKIPVHKDFQADCVKAGLDWRQALLLGGEDYKLLFTVKALGNDLFQKKMNRHSHAFWPVGVVVNASKGLIVLDEEGNNYQGVHGSFDHFNTVHS